jgi:peptidoglycan hydrolase-like protein with peptidoglycan-binding domain
MRKFGFIILVLGLAVYLTGCGKKQQSLEEMQEPMSMEVMSMLNNSTNTGVNAPTATTPVAGAPATVAAPAAKLEPLPPAGPYKPTDMEIQNALKNAGFYTGNVDGKVGPKTKKAIEAFQKANGLKADGKVGPKTWIALSKHLTAQAEAAAAPLAQ